MKRRAFQISPRHRRILHAVSLVLFVSGAAWACVHRLDEQGNAGDALRTFKPWLMKVHGFAAVGFVLLLGTLLPTHVRRAWHARKNRANGAFFLGAMSLLTIFGYALYYLSDETWRNTFSQFHLWLGLSSPLLLFWHIRSGRRATAEGQRHG